VRKTSAPHSW